MPSFNREAPNKKKKMLKKGHDLEKENHKKTKTTNPETERGRWKADES